MDRTNFAPVWQLGENETSPMKGATPSFSAPMLAPGVAFRPNHPTV
jgi:hypothetical protein